MGYIMRCNMEEHLSHELCPVGYPVGNFESACTPWGAPWCPFGWHMGPPVGHILWRPMGEFMGLKPPWYTFLGIPGAPRGTYIPTFYIGHMGHNKEPRGLRRDNSWSIPRRAPSREFVPWSNFLHHGVTHAASKGANPDRGHTMC